MFLLKRMWVTFLSCEYDTIKFVYAMAPTVVVEIASSCILRIICHIGLTFGSTNFHMQGKQTTQGNCHFKVVL